MAAATGPETRPASIAADAASTVQPVGTELNPSMSAALESVAQRYRVAPEALKPIFFAAQQAARELDPLLIIAVIGVESGFNPFAQSVMGAQGLMQVIPRYHRDKLPPETPPAAFLDPVSNVRVGAQVLQEAIRRSGGLIEGLQYYAGAADDPERGYATRVIAEKQRLDIAARARKGPAAAITTASRQLVPAPREPAKKND
ncbi:MAG: transglycosylase SLT domain-containing protein [Rhodocyclales bacterium]|nr:transglycosylase SLT domain-containing protein [Rhodocyclales bacterium]